MIKLRPIAVFYSLNFTMKKIGHVFQILITKGGGIKTSVQRRWYYWAKVVIYLNNPQKQSQVNFP